MDGSYKDEKAGVGIVIKRNSSVIRLKRYRVTNCTSPHHAEKVAVSVGVEAVLKNGTNPKRAVVYTDCLNVVKELDGKLHGIPVIWIPRELNEAHDMSVIGRTMTRQSTSRYRNFEKLNGRNYL